MATLRGPLGSLQAAGSLAGALTFAKRGRSTTAYARTSPSQPNTPAQIGRRVMFSFLGSQWPFLAPIDQATWETNFKTPHPYAFLNYQSCNLARWTAFLAPSQASPPTEATTPTKYDTFSATGRTGYVDLRWRQFSPPNAWGWAIFRDLSSGFTRSPHTLVAVHPVVGSGFITRSDGPLPPGTYYYLMASFSPDGKWLFKQPQKTAVVT